MNRGKLLFERLQSIKRKALAMRIIPDGADKPLIPATSADSEIDPEDTGETALWDRLMPKYRGILNATVVNKQRYDE